MNVEIGGGEGREGEVRGGGNIKIFHLRRALAPDFIF